MDKRLALLAIRLLVSVNLLYAAIFLKFAGVPGSVTLFTQMSQTVHGLVSQPVFRLGSGVFETVLAVLLLVPKTARSGARLTVVWMTAVLLSHIFGVSGSAPGPEDSQIWSAIDGCVDDCRTSQPHFRVGIWFVLCRCSHGDAAGCYLSLADAQASSHSRWPETALKLIVIR